jgi:urease accessory protein UreE
VFAVRSVDGTGLETVPVGGVMRCEPVRLRDGSTVLVSMKHGEKLTDEDRAVLEEFAEFLRIRKADDSDGAITVLDDEGQADE